MAKKKNDNATGVGLYIGCLLMMTIGIVFITLFSIAIQLIPLAVPIIIFLIFVGALFLYVGEDGQNVKRKFKLTDNEQVEFDKLGHLLNQAYRKINECKNIIETEHLHINQNGRLSQRSYRGSEVQGAMDYANSTINENSNHYQRLRLQPITQWKTARKHYAKLLGGMFATIIWGFMVFGNSTNTIHEFKQYAHGIGSTASTGTSMVGDIWKGAFKNKPHKKDKKNEHIFPKKTKLGNHFASLLWKAMFLMMIIYSIAWVAGFFLFWVRNHKPEESKHIQ